MQIGHSYYYDNLFIYSSTRITFGELQYKLEIKYLFFISLFCKKKICLTSIVIQPCSYNRQ